MVSWLLVLLFFIVGISLHSFKGHLPNVLTYPVAEIFLMSSLLIAARGNRQFFDIAPFPYMKMVLGFCSLIFIAYLWNFYKIESADDEQSVFRYIFNRSVMHCFLWLLLCIPILHFFVELKQKNLWSLGISMYSLTMLVLTGVVVVFPLLFIFQIVEFNQLNFLLVIFSSSLCSLSLVLTFSVLCFERNEQKLQQLQILSMTEAKEKTQLLDWISHEVRTPINAMVGHAKIIADLCKEQRHLMHHCNVITQSGLMLGEQINYMLSGRGGSFPELSLPNVVHLSGFSDQILSLLQPLAESKHLTLECNISDELPASLEMPDKEIRLVLINLLNNAIKYTEAGKVSLGIRQIASEANDKLLVEFSVYDSGPGISSELQQLIFSPFFQVEQSQQVEQGMGLGLFICQTVLGRYGSELTLNSKTGEGSRFAFNMSLSQNKGDSPAPLQEYEIPSQSVLLVEDIAINREVISYYLVEQKHKVENATTGEQALALLNQQRFDLMLLDIHLPDMEALQLIKKCLRLPYSPGLAGIVIVSADSKESIQRTYRQIGIKWWLNKPVDPMQLKSCLFFAHADKVAVNKTDYQQGTGITINKKGFSWLADSLSRQQMEQLKADTPQKLRSMLSDIEHAFEKQEREVLNKALHRMASCSATLAMSALSDKVQGYCDEVEQFSLEPIQELVEISLAVFISECDKLLEHD